MTKAEEIRLHNLFIKFKNEGKELDEIKGFLEVDGEILDKWDESFLSQKELSEQKDNPFEIKIIGLRENGEYVLNNSIEFTLNQLEKVKFDLFRIVNTIKDGEEENYYQSNAKKYFPIFDEYVTGLDKIEVIEGKFSANLKLNTNEKDVIDLVHEALSFYVSFLEEEKKLDKLFSKLIKNITVDIFNDTKKILPYCLKTLKAKSLDGIKETGFEMLPIDANWIFLIGENGYGKTTLLRSIAIGLIGQEDEGTELLGVKSSIGIEYFNLSRSIINNVWIEDVTPLTHLACYGPSRLQIQTEQTQNDVAKKSTTTYSLFNSDGVLLNIEFELLIWFLEKNPRFDSVKQTFLKLIPYLSDIQVDVPKRKVFYIEKEPTENGVKYKPVTFNELASGFRSILAMVGDMMIRLFKSQPDITEPSELAGIVIIDEIDLHWHPKMQREIPSLLSSIFPKVQFIASTHSLVPLLGAPENSVLLKVNRTVKEGITVEKMEIDFQALSSDTMLRDIFDLEKYQSDAKLKAWERYTKLKGLIHFEKDETQKNEYIHEREILGDKYNFTL